jgi:hypothetical protein
MERTVGRHPREPHTRTNPEGSAAAADTWRSKGSSSLGEERNRMHHKGELFRALARFCLYAFVLSSSVACAVFGGGVKQDEEGLQKSVEAFNAAVRWNDFKGATAFLPIPARERFWNLVDQMEAKVRIMEFEIREVMQDKLLPTGTVFIRFRYYRTNDPHVLMKTVQQKWRYEEKDKTWLVVEHNLNSLLPEK